MLWCLFTHFISFSNLDVANTLLSLLQSARNKSGIFWPTNFEASWIGSNDDWWEPNQRCKTFNFVENWENEPGTQQASNFLMKWSVTDVFTDGTARHGTTWHDMARQGTTGHDRARQGTTWHSTARQGTVRYGLRDLIGRRLAPEDLPVPIHAYEKHDGRRKNDTNVPSLPTTCVAWGNWSGTPYQYLKISCQTLWA